LNLEDTQDRILSCIFRILVETIFTKVKILLEDTFTKIFQIKIWNFTNFERDCTYCNFLFSWFSWLVLYSLISVILIISLTSMLLIYVTLTTSVVLLNFEEW